MKLANNPEEKSYHKSFYREFADFITVFCKDLIPEAQSSKDWDLIILKELEFVSQFFLLETNYYEPSKKYKAQTTQSDI